MKVLLFVLLIIAPAAVSAGIAFATSSLRLIGTVAALAIVVATALTVLASRGSTDSGWVLDLASGLFVAVASSVIAMLMAAVIVAVRTARPKR